MRRSRLRSLVATLLALMLILAACGNGDDADDPAPEPDVEAEADDAEDDAPLALELDEPEPVEDETEEAADEPAEAEDFDLVAAVDAYASTIPEGWMLERDVDAFKDALQVEGTVLIDVREDGEFAEGHIPGAISMPIRTVGQNLELIPRDRPVWIYCLSGWRAGLVISSLRLLGYDNVLAFSPGINGWDAAGEELVNEDNVAENFGDPGLQPELVEAVDLFLATLPEGFLTNQLDAVKDAMDAGAVLVDMREPEEYEEGFIPDALSVPLRTIVSTDVEVPMDTDVIIYCQSGFRAALALPLYHIMGYTNTSGFPGSFNAWVEADEAIAF